MSHATIPRTALRLSSQSSRPLQTRAIGPTSRHLLARPTSLPQCFSKPRRTFLSTPPLHKKAKNEAFSDGPPTGNKSRQPTATDDVLDLSTVETEILKAIEKLSHTLSQLRSGGRLNPEVVEGLKVQLGTAGKDGHGKESVRLGDVAQVVPRGRMLQVICGEVEHVKPISTAIAASPHSLTPLSPESSSPLTIQVPLPPPTGESRRRAVDAATRAAEVADKWIQSARATHNKKLRKFSLDKSVLPDDLQKAHKRMEEVVKKGHAEVKRIVEGAKKVLES
ncbi:ribosome recycling factor [Lentithecium fluviatile CBS 122367]|uniref:Ribosome recycling factor n=1 Tax=Lentithecium fluviatile CBS 122367 TaxID=1168545 RepID=A0A6G1IJ85_9PLEO|nr:ribosome recycling factor [Lentithecium fluviatile CBS 122367]